MNRIHRAAGPVACGVSLALFAGFHFYPAFAWAQGWQFWADSFEALVDQQTLLKGAMAPSIALFATFSAGVVFSPFAAHLMQKSLLMRWFVAFFSGLAALGLLLTLLAVGPSRMQLGGIFLLLSAVCNFAGIVLIPYDGRHQEVLRKLSGN